MALFFSSTPQSIRLRYGVAALVVLAITLINLHMQMVEAVRGNDQCRWTDIGPSMMSVSQIVPGGVADQAGLKDGDVIIRIQGKEYKQSPEAQMRIDKAAGTTVVYEIERNGVRMTMPVLILKSVSLRFLAQFLYGLGFLIVGIVVLFVRPQGEVQRAFASFSIWSMFFFGLSELNINRNAFSEPRSILLLSSSLIVTIGALPVFIRFFLLFPVRLKWFERRAVTAVLYVLSILIAVVFIVAVNHPAFNLASTIAYYMRYGFYLAGLSIFIRAYLVHVRRERRRALRPILAGVALAAATFIYALAITAINPFAAFLNPTIIFPVMLLVLVPVMFGYAIFRYGLMDVDFFVQRTLTYGALTMSIAAIYMVVVYGIGTFVTAIFGVGDNGLLAIAALIVSAAAFEPLKGRLQQSIDRLFYRERTDYQQALLEFSEELPRKLDLREILNALLSRISGTMHIDKVAVIICDDREGCLSVGKNVPPQDREFTESSRSLQELLRKTRKPQDFHLLEDGLETFDLAEEEIEKLTRAGVVLTVPMFLKDRLVGFINVGPKMSGRLFSREDVNLLATVAAQAAIAIENARLHISEREKERIGEELALAREIQRGLLPAADPDIVGFDIAGISIPAASVGGDYYDYIRTAPHRLLVVVADVSGKGMSAALYMSKVQGMVQLAAHMYSSPREMLVHINRRIFERIDRRSFITMTLAQFDLRKKEVRICRAGHTKTIMSKKSGLTMLEGGGIGLGLERGPVFEEQLEELRIPLGREGVFVFYTDGVTETMNVANEQMGEDRMLEVLRASREDSALEMQKAVLAAADEFRGTAEQHDDITMVIVKGNTRTR